jgi:hypothetical protein
MGVFHSDVTIQKGLKRIVRNPRVKKKKHAGRTVDDMTVIQIRGMTVGPAVGGDLVVRSSNTCTPTFGAGWSGGAQARIETRLRDSDGGQKGRVLYGELVCMNAEPTVVCAVCLHVERCDSIVITGFDHTSELTSHRAVLFDAMLLAVECVACEYNGGRPAMIVLDVQKDAAGWYKDNFGFKEAAKHPYGKHRRLLHRRGHDDCGKDKKKSSDRVGVQTAAR